MFSRLKTLLFGPPREPRRAVVDDVLGACTPDALGWKATVTIDGRKIGFTLGGRLAPDPALVQHAREIAAELPAFERGVREFLDRAAADLPPESRAEIEGLEIDDVCLFWPERPDDGMIYFAGGSEDRVWRCNYIQRQCRDLGFDS